MEQLIVFGCGFVLGQFYLALLIGLTDNRGGRPPQFPNARRQAW